VDEAMGKFVWRMRLVLASASRCFVKLHSGLVEGRFVERVNRFVVRGPWTDGMFWLICPIQGG
jgi:hypothetical protein